MTTLRISITKEVLEATKDCGQVASKSITESCAIAYAIREIWPKGFAVYTLIGTGGEHLISHNQADFIRRFDRATPAELAAMQPFSFEIEVPDSVIGEVNIEEIGDIIKNSKTLELV